MWDRKDQSASVLIWSVVGLIVGGVGRAWFDGDIDLVALTYRWQTLTAGMLALLGARMTVVVIQAQLAQDDIQFEDVKKRKGRATRAVAVMALADVSHYADEACKWTEMLPEDKAGLTDDLKAKIEAGLPKIPDGAISKLTEAMEYAQPEEIAKITELFERLQIQNSRMRHVSERVRGRDLGERDNITPLNNSVSQQLLDAAIVHGMAGRLFKWARDRKPIIETRSDREVVANSLSVLGVDVESYPGVWELFDAHYPKEDNEPGLGDWTAVE